jgi:alkanesulfonate monooxygenase SsuD/methylene tetrahydromethanopterin reductase-like flavin-dependent oxidoreductase (luciferase family)
VEVWLFNIRPWPYDVAEIGYPFPSSLYDAGRAKALYDGAMAVDRRADELGFDGVCFAEHHYGRTAVSPSPNLLAAAVATHTERAKIVLMGNCLPLHAHPVRLAEELAMIDVLSGGRLVSGFIRGGTREYEGYGINIREGRAMYEEAWDLIVKAWTDPEPFAWHGTHYNYDVISILPRPVQEPHPPIIVGANTAESLEWAAEKRVRLITSLSPTAQIAQTLDYYRKYAAEECGWTPTSEHTGVSRHVYVGTTDAKAREECLEHVQNTFGSPRASTEKSEMRERDTGRHTERSFAYKTQQHEHRSIADRVDLDRLSDDGYLIVGSPDTVTRKIKEQQAALGVGLFVPYIPFGSMEPARALTCVELFGKEVLPHLQSES